MTTIATPATTPKARTRTTTEAEALLVTKLQPFRDELPADDKAAWPEIVDVWGNMGRLNEVYALAANLGYLRADVRFTIWGA